MIFHGRKTLKDTGQLENTVVFFTSDNGANEDVWPDSGFRPWKGGKGTTWEGGIRVPGIAYWSGMIKEGREIAAIHPNMVVKIPMTVEGLKACKVLTAEGIKTNVTLIFTANQALLAARAGATYVSPFLGRLDDISTRGVDLIREIAEIFDVAGLDTQIIAASVRNPIHVTDCALAGADIATVPYAVIEQMIKHPLTDAGIKKFQDDYKAVFGE
mgnify:CR=1 FL=1